MKAQDLTGMKFGHLTVIELAEPRGGKRCYRCVCDCGKETVVIASNLKRGNTQSCGCLRTNKIVLHNKIHGMKKTKLYGIWSSMRSRCNNPHNKEYHRYGGRGISCCKEWGSFIPFKEWALKGMRVDYRLIESTTTEIIAPKIADGQQGSNNPQIQAKMFSLLTVGRQRRLRNGVELLVLMKPD